MILMCLLSVQHGGGPPGHFDRGPPGRVSPPRDVRPPAAALPHPPPRDVQGPPPVAPSHDQEKVRTYLVPLKVILLSGERTEHQACVCIEALELFSRCWISCDQYPRGIGIFFAPSF